MLDLVLENVSIKRKTLINSILAISLVILAVALPQLVHLFAGPTGGMIYLPMYLPVLIAGLLLNRYYSLGVAVFAPLTSLAFTSLALGSPMPTLERLPFMITELIILALVASLFTKLIAKNSFYSILAVLVAQIISRFTFLGLAAIFSNITSLNASLVFNQIVQGLPGIAIQLVVAPLVVILISYLNKKENG